jgi:hypothetical protein
MHLEWLGDNQLTVFADTCSVLNELDLQSLFNYCIVPKEVLQGTCQPIGLLQFPLLLEGTFHLLH